MHLNSLIRDRYYCTMSIMKYTFPVTGSPCLISVTGYKKHQNTCTLPLKVCRILHYGIWSSVVFKLVCVANVSVHWTGFSVQLSILANTSLDMATSRMGIRSKLFPISKKLNIINKSGWCSESTLYQNHWRTWHSCEKNYPQNAWTVRTVENMLRLPQIIQIQHTYINNSKKILKKSVPDPFFFNKKS
jgi:hypothetical protein